MFIRVPYQILNRRELGLYAHAMAGFNTEKAYNVLGVLKDEYHVMAAIAVGRKDESIDELLEDLRAMESPNARKAPSEVATDQFPISG
jgi:hypothetical protein